jgi:hypothetical protein
MTLGQEWTVYFYSRDALGHYEVTVGQKTLQ